METVISVIFYFSTVVATKSVMMRGIEFLEIKATFKTKSHMITDQKKVFLKIVAIYIFKFTNSLVFFQKFKM